MRIDLKPDLEEMIRQGMRLRSVGSSLTQATSVRD
jgi:hypothetical protein